MNNPAEYLPYISELQDSVLSLLEAAGIDTATNDAIVNLIIAAEERQAIERNANDALAARLDFVNHRGE